MNKSTVIIIVVLIIAGGGWYFYSQQNAGSGVPEGTSSQTPSGALGTNDSPEQTNTAQPAAPLVSVAHDAKLGDYLVAANGMTLYKYTKDTEGISNCSGQCAVNWPPYTAPDAEPLTAAAGIGGTLATITRSDYSGAQITYNGVPLYFWKKDTKPGDTTGQNVGGVWFVVKP